MYVYLGIGLLTGAALRAPEGVKIEIHAENGIMGLLLYLSDSADYLLCLFHCRPRTIQTNISSPSDGCQIHM